MLETDELGMIVACGQGGVAIKEVHPSGKRRMAALDWAQGRGCKVGDRFEQELSRLHGATTERAAHQSGPPVHISRIYCLRIRTR